MAIPAKVVAAALELPREQRAELAAELLRSLDEASLEQDEQIDAAWAVEVERRIVEREAGHTAATPLSAALTEIKADLAARRAGSAR